jgi:hypothetical protein
VDTFNTKKHKRRTLLFNRSKISDILSEDDMSNIISFIFLGQLNHRPEVKRASVKASTVKKIKFHRRAKTRGINNSELYRLPRNIKPFSLSNRRNKFDSLNDDILSIQNLRSQNPNNSIYDKFSMK